MTTHQAQTAALERIADALEQIAEALTPRPPAPVAPGERPPGPADDLDLGDPR